MIIAAEPCRFVSTSLAFFTGLEIPVAGFAFSFVYKLLSFVELFSFFAFSFKSCLSLMLLRYGILCSSSTFSNMLSFLPEPQIPFSQNMTTAKPPNGCGEFFRQVLVLLSLLSQCIFSPTILPSRSLVYLSLYFCPNPVANIFKDLLYVHQPMTMYSTFVDTASMQCRVRF